MDDELATEIGLVAGKLVQQAMECGLTWDEAVAAFGLAAKASAGAPVSAGNGEDCIEFARRRLEEAFAHDVRVVISEAGARASSAEVEGNALLATARRRHAVRLHCTGSDRCECGEHLKRNGPAIATMRWRARGELRLLRRAA